jgi:hypothetical protein
VPSGPVHRGARHGAALAAIVSLILAVPDAYADEATDPAPVEQLAERAYELHAAHRDAESIALYLQAYDASNAAVILFNVATIYDHRLHDPERAAEYYGRYIRAADAQPDLVAKATARLDALRSEAAPTALPQPPAATAVATSVPKPAAPSQVPPAEASPRAAGSPPSSAVRTAGFIVGGVGLASVGTSLILGALAKSKNDDANAICNGNVCPSDRGVLLAHEAGHLATASTVTFIGGMALAGGGLLMVILAPRGSVAFQPALGPGSAGLDVQGRF